MRKGDPENPPPPKKAQPISLKTQVTISGSPFISTMLKEPMEHFKIQVCRYDGTTDPEDHRSAYEGHMMLYTSTNSVWCKVFQSTLTGIAQSWFKSIPKSTVTSWADLAKKFMTHFVSNIRRVKMSADGDQTERKA